MEASGLEVDESLLTGEPRDPQSNRRPDHVRQLRRRRQRPTGRQKVGREAYAARPAEEASKFTLVKSELRSGIKQNSAVHHVPTVAHGAVDHLHAAFHHTRGLAGICSADGQTLVPMVPEGLVLMTSIAFAVGVIRLGRRQCLVQELPAIEGLARVDVVCADKTGTLTENGMRVSDVAALGDDDVADVLAAMAANDPGRTPACRRSPKSTRTHLVGR